MAKKLLIIALILIIVAVGLFFLLDPLEWLRQGRDEKRVSDLENLKKAVDLYIDNNAKEIAAQGSLLCTNCKIGEKVFSFRAVDLPDGSSSVERPFTYVNANGWLPLDLSLNAKIGQTPLKLLPVDPLEKGYLLRTKLPFLKTQENFVYTYSAGVGDKYKFTARVESKAGLEKAKNDGGRLANFLEVGSDLTLEP